MTDISEKLEQIEFKLIYLETKGQPNFFAERGGGK